MNHIGLMLHGSKHFSTWEEIAANVLEAAGIEKPKEVQFVKKVCGIVGFVTKEEDFDDKPHLHVTYYNGIKPTSLFVLKSKVKFITETEFDNYHSSRGNTAMFSRLADFRERGY